MLRFQTAICQKPQFFLGDTAQWGTIMTFKNKKVFSKLRKKVFLSSLDRDRLGMSIFFIISYIGVKENVPKVDAIIISISSLEVY